MDRVGRDGVITVQDGRTLEDELELTEGLKFDRGYISSYFVTDTRAQTVTFENPYILIVDGRISSVTQIGTLLQSVFEQGKPLLIIADDLDTEVLQMLVVNKLRGTVKVAAVKSPGFGVNRKGQLGDIAVLTGGTFVTEDAGMQLKDATVDHLGQAARVVVTKDDTLIMGGAGDGSAIQDRASELRFAMEQTDSTYDRENFESRIAKLTGGVAVLRVGGASETEVSERRDRVVDALSATKAAVAEGIVPGGGVALLRASRHARALRLPDFDQQQGAELLVKACQEPARLIVANAGHEASIVVNRILAMRGESRGFDAASETYVDMLEAGIIDPTKVVKTALLSASRQAALMLTAEALVVDTPKPDDAPAAPTGMIPGAGMGGAF